MEINREKRQIILKKYLKTFNKNFNFLQKNLVLLVSSFFIIFFSNELLSKETNKILNPKKIHTVINKPSSEHEKIISTRLHNDEANFQQVTMRSFYGHTLSDTLVLLGQSIKDIRYLQKKLSDYETNKISKKITKEIGNMWIAKIYHTESFEAYKEDFLKILKSSDYVTKSLKIRTDSKKTYKPATLDDYKKGLDIQIKRKLKSLKYTFLNVYRLLHVKMDPNEFNLKNDLLRLLIFPYGLDHRLYSNPLFYINKLNHSKELKDILKFGYIKLKIPSPYIKKIPYLLHEYINDPITKGAEILYNNNFWHGHLLIFGKKQTYQVFKKILDIATLKTETQKKYTGQLQDQINRLQNKTSNNNFNNQQRKSYNIIIKESPINDYVKSKYNLKPKSKYHDSTFESKFAKITLNSRTNKNNIFINLDLKRSYADDWKLTQKLKRLVFQDLDLEHTSKEDLPNINIVCLQHACLSLSDMLVKNTLPKNIPDSLVNFIFINSQAFGNSNLPILTNTYLLSSIFRNQISPLLDNKIDKFVLKKDAYLPFDSIYLLNNYGGNIDSISYRRSTKLNAPKDRINKHDYSQKNYFKINLLKNKHPIINFIPSNKIGSPSTAIQTNKKNIYSTVSQILYGPNNGFSLWADANVISSNSMTIFYNKELFKDLNSIETVLSLINSLK